MVNEVGTREKPCGGKEGQQPSSEVRRPSKILDRLSLLTAVVTIVTFLKDSAEIAGFVLENTKTSLAVGGGLALLLVVDLWPRLRKSLAGWFSRFHEVLEDWRGRSGLRRTFTILKFSVVAFALLLIVVGGLALSTRGVFYVILESSQTEGVLVDRATELNSALEEEDSDLKLRVLSPREGDEYFALATGPYIRRAEAEEDLERLRNVLEEQVREDAWISKATLSTVSVLLRRGVE